jgi:iron complex transport system ATP-binding protein
VITVKDVAFSYVDECTLRDITFSVNKGEVFGVLGPNGSGKTTLLKLLARTFLPTNGEILLNERSLHSFSNKEYAKQVAVLPQLMDTTFSYSVKETVMMGRYAHQSGLFPTWSEKDEQVVQKALQDTSIVHLQNKGLQELSGGEQQRVFLARALAGQPQLLLLDEPTNHLDVSYQINLFDRLRNWKRERNLTVIAIFHDLNLASLYCDRILLLHHGQIVSLGVPKEIMQAPLLEKVYNTTIVRKEHPEVARPFIGLVPELENEQSRSIIENIAVDSSKDRITLTSPSEFKTLSSALIGGGFHWSNTFVNRHVGMDYQCDDAAAEMTRYLLENNLNPSNTIGMMTAVNLQDAVIKKETFPEGTIMVMVTAGTGNAVDSSNAFEHHFTPTKPGTINIFVLIEAKLTEAAFVQVLTTATEAKTKALSVEKIVDQTTNHIATGTSTDSICIAATQTAVPYEYGGPLTPIGKWVGKLVFEATSESIQKYKKRKLDAN